MVGVSSRLVEYHVDKPMAAIPKPLTDYQNFRNNIEDDFDSDLVMRLSRDEIFDLLYTAQMISRRRRSCRSIRRTRASVYSCILKRVSEQTRSNAVVMVQKNAALSECYT